MKAAFGVSIRMLSFSILASAFVLGTRAQDSHYAPFSSPEQLLNSPPCLTIRMPWEDPDIPCTPLTHQVWLADLIHWRTERRIRTGYDPARYTLPALQWAQSSFIQPQMMVHDRYFFDPAQGEYTVDRYLDDLEKRYGGIDSVLIWATYPNMGIDDRNQQDMVRSMPGGVEGVKKMVADFHRRGVRVLFPMMMWDQGTRDPGKPWPDAVAELMKQIDADGINGDTQDGVPLAFSLAAEKVGHPLAFEPEVGLSDEALAWDVMSWGYYSKFVFVPQVDRFRWLEPRHMVNVCDRWNRSKTDNWQFAFFNGEGWESWENIWGIWNGITPRDSEATRRVATIERAFAPFLVSQDWEPLYPMHMSGVFASRWPLGDQTLWTIVNRDEFDVNGPQMTVPFTPGIHYFDLYHGVELHPVQEGSQSVLSFPMEAHGYGAILAAPGPADAAAQQLMAKMNRMTAKPLATFSDQRQTLTQQIIDIGPTKLATSTPEGMIPIPGSDFLFKVKGMEIEGSNDIGVDVQYPWEDSPRRDHEHLMQIKPFYIDKYPVTNAEFKKFLDATLYHPKDDLNLLKDWNKGTYPEGWGNKPVTWVSLEDARAYAEWAGKRLPHEWEWQYAAEGSDARAFPWGNCEFSASQFGSASQPCPLHSNGDDSPTPLPDRGRIMLPASDVDAHPKGASPFGVMDIVGNVWQWTDEYTDDHTRAAILRGGSHYQPQGSLWYFPQAYRNDQHGKLLLMAPGYDRSGAVGFRCVKDAE
jgi:iron(II)-dependent oxidoreductase